MVSGTRALPKLVVLEVEGKAASKPEPQPEGQNPSLYAQNQPKHRSLAPLGPLPLSLPHPNLHIGAAGTAGC